MLYRIDLQHFITHAIDYFTQEELIHFQYLIMSAKILSQGRITSVSKASVLWPDVDLIVQYAETHNYDVFKKGYFDFLDTKETKESNVSWAGVSIYKSIVNLVIEHVDLILICDREENFILDAFCEYLKDKWHLEAIDLNTLFKTGKIGPYYIDRADVRDRAVDIRRAAGMDMLASLDSSPEGRLKHLKLMGKKDKIAKLKEIGIKVNDGDKDKLDALLIDSWVNVDEDE